MHWILLPGHLALHCFTIDSRIDSKTVSVRTDSSDVIYIVQTISYCTGLDAAFFWFRDDDMFYDLSTYNFAFKRDCVYTYNLTARDNHQVNLYLFQNNFKQYSMTVYDGVSEKAAKLPVFSYPSIGSNVDWPRPIRSTGKYMFIRLTPDNTDLASKVDFQAFATDYAQPAECGNMVENVNVPDTHIGDYDYATNAKRECYYYWGKMNIYKGLSLDEGTLLGAGNLSPYPTFGSVSDKYLVLWPQENSTFGSDWHIPGSIDVDVEAKPNTHGIFMTNDYYQNRYPNLRSELEQTFTLRRNKNVTAIQVCYVRIVGVGQQYVTGYKNNKQVYEKKYLPGPIGPETVIYEYDEIRHQYSTNRRNLYSASGFFAYYDDVNITTTTAATTKITKYAVSPRPLPTTTSHSTRISVIVVIVASIVLLIIRQ